MNHQEGGMNL